MCENVTIEIAAGDWAPFNQCIIAQWICVGGFWRVRITFFRKGDLDLALPVSEI